MKYLSIKNFAKHQHYKNRRPLWIKLYGEILDDYGFVCLQDASRSHLILLWVLASRLENRIPYDVDFIQKAIKSTTPIDIEGLIAQGFMEMSEDASNVLASRKQVATLETEREKEKKLLVNTNGSKPFVPEKPPAVPKSKRGALLVATVDEAEVFRYYHDKHPRRGPYDNDQLRKVRKGLLSFSVCQLKQAIDGNLLDEWAVKNHKHGIGWIFKSNDNISENIDRATAGEVVLVGDDLKLTPAGEKFFARAH